MQGIVVLKPFCMKTNSVAVISGLMAALVIVAACSSLRPKEPSYEGKMLSVWMTEHNSWTNQDEPPARYTAEEATWTNVVRAVGTNGLPFYSHWMGDAADPFRQYRSQQAIEILGPAAEPIIPILAGLLKDNKTASGAASCLLAIGPASIPSLIEAVETLTNRGQSYSITMLGEFGPAAKTAVPVLARIIQSDSPLTWPAMQALVEIESNTDVVLALLTPHMSDTNCGSGVTYALGRLGNTGVPLLLMSLTNETRSLRCFAAGALDTQFQKYSLDKYNTNTPRFRVLCCEYNLRTLNAAVQCYSKGDFVAATWTAEQFTNNTDIKIREAAENALSILRPMAETNVPQSRIDETDGFTPKPR